MTELQVQNLLRNHADAFDQLRSLGIKTRAHGAYPNLIQFTYNQIASAAVKDHAIVMECRGLILDRDASWDVVAFPFTRFFNWGEPGAADIDWSSARIQEKLDGSLIIVYWYAGAWHAATKGTPDGVATTWDGSTTYAQYFWQAVDRSHYDIRAALTPGWTYCFEVTGEATRVVTQQAGNLGAATLLAVRDPDGVEQDVMVWADRVPVVRHFDFHTAEAVNAAADALDPIAQEGFVVVDAGFQRVKIKSPRYVALHYNKFTLSRRGIIELIQTGETAEVLTYFPELQERYSELTQKLQNYGAQIDFWYQRVLGSMGDFIVECDREGDQARRKHFAQVVQAKVPVPMRGAMFSLMAGKQTSGYQWLINQYTQRIMDILEIAEDTTNVVD